MSEVLEWRLLILLKLWKPKKMALCCQKSKEYATRKTVAKKSVLDPSDTVETQPLAEVSSRLPDTCRATRREQFSVEKIIKLDKKM